jgi:hypothetical protein
MVVILVILCLPLQAQYNLVPNGDFEQYVSCPWDSDGIDINVSYWFTPLSLVKVDSIGSSDYYHECGHENFAPSTSCAGIQIPRSGEAYAGICLGQYVYTKDWDGKEYWDEYREYLEVELDSTLKPGGRYCYELFYSIAEYFAEDYKPVFLGILLTDTIVKRKMELQHFTTVTVDFPLPVVSPYAIQELTIPDIDKDQWIRITGEFIANGNEKYLTIGNFSPEDSLTVKCVYVYIDDVNLWLCEDEPDSQPLLLVCYPSPADGVITFSFNQVPEDEKATLEIFTRHGEQIGVMKLATGVEEMKFFTGNLAQGIYLARITYSTGEQASVKFMVRH